LTLIDIDIILINNKITVKAAYFRVIIYKQAMNYTADQASAGYKCSSTEFQKVPRF